MRKISCLCWGLLLFSLILAGCGKLDRKGTKPVNIPPRVFFANIPPDEARFSVSPRIYWYGTDNDGYITAYQYAVIRNSVIESWGGGNLQTGLEAAKDSLEVVKPDSISWMNTLARLDIVGDHIAAEEGHQRKVIMYAEIKPDEYTPQHIFLRAVDNAIGISEIKTRMYWRNNHAPQCSVDVDTVFLNSSFYCLPETTETWKGIEIEWVGSDTIDYPEERDQPDFYFRWELWGPYGDASYLDDPNASMVQSSLDSVESNGEWFRDVWSLNKSHVFKDLENYPNMVYGLYQLRVWARDDALVSSDSATIFFRILKPVFRYQESNLKTILVVNATDYVGGADGRPPASLIEDFYETALSQPGICYRYNIYRLSKEVPNEDTLSQYDLVIVVNLGKNNGIIDKDADYAKYINYLDVGGRVWIIGINSYPGGNLAGDPNDPQDQGISGTNPYTFKFATKYLGLAGSVAPVFTPANPLTLEFIGTDPYGSWDLPPLEIDANKAAQLFNYDSTSPGLNFPVNGIPRVRYVILANDLDFDRRAPRDRRSYSFVSRLGLDSKMHLNPSGHTYIGSTFRTAEFAFPLSVMQEGDGSNPGGLDAFSKMVEWFWEDLP